MQGFPSKGAVLPGRKSATSGILQHADSYGTPVGCKNKSCPFVHVADTQAPSKRRGGAMARGKAVMEDMERGKQAPLLLLQHSQSNSDEGNLVGGDSGRIRSPCPSRLTSSHSGRDRGLKFLSLAVLCTSCTSEYSKASVGEKHVSFPKAWKRVSQ